MMLSVIIITIIISLSFGMETSTLEKQNTTQQQQQQFQEQQPHPLCDNATTILSIDGGIGIRGGIIPSVALYFLETELQKLDGKHARLADYFDVMAGTSSGGLIATLLSTPNDKSRPIFTAKDVVDFYVKHSPILFPPVRSNNPLGRAGEVIKPDSEHPLNLTRRLLKDKRLRDTLTNVVIPTYDVKTLQPTIFSSYQLKKDPSLDAKLSDICIGTSSAPPTYPSPHSFQVKDSEGRLLRDFNLIDGGVAANNPTMAAIREASMDRRESRECGRFLVLSLGTGSPSPWVDGRGNFDFAEYYILSLLELVHSDKYYLRIQEDNLSDGVTLENIVEVGEELLKKWVTRVNTSNFILEHDHKKTNELALKEFAAKLHKRRMSKIPTL